MEGSAVPSGPLQTVINRMKTLRAERGLTAQQLAEAMTRAGVPWEAGVVTKLETGRRKSLNVDELLALAYVLEVPPVLLFFPVGSQQAVEVLPGISVDTYAAVQWFSGQRPLGDDAGPERSVLEPATAWDRAAQPLALYSWHDRQLNDLRRRTRQAESSRGAAAKARSATRAEVHQASADAALEAIAATQDALVELRRAMRNFGIQPPSLPQEFAYIDAPKSDRRGAAASGEEKGTDDATGSDQGD